MCVLAGLLSSLIELKRAAEHVVHHPHPPHPPAAALLLVVPAHPAEPPEAARLGPAVGVRLGSPVRSHARRGSTGRRVAATAAAATVAAEPGDTAGPAVSVASVVTR